jgi:hypothetical protein
MPDESQYTEQIIEFAQRAQRPITVPEIQGAVGLSRQGAYYWMKNQGERLFVAVGRGRNGGTAYVLVNDDELAEYRRDLYPRGEFTVFDSAERVTFEEPNIRVGSQFIVVAKRMENGDQVVDLRDDKGQVLTINLGLI